MCGRYTLASSVNYKKRFGLLDQPPGIKKNYNISPGSTNPVITKNSPNSLVFMRWGLIPFWKKDENDSGGIINARCEGIENKPSFRKPIRQQRCLVLSTGFYEWKRLNLEGKEEKFPFYITLKNQHIFSFAGIYDVWESKKGEKIKTYAIITTKSSGKIKDIHERMPVIVDEKNEEIYLNKKTKFENVLSLLKPIQSDRLVFYPVSKRVNDPQNDDQSLLDEISVLS